MIRVVVTGSECTGKTTLARALAEHYQAVWVPEYSREYVAEQGAAPTRDDVDAIARGQMAREDALELRASGLLVQDTDLLSTVVYARHYYGESPAWIVETLRDRAADLYLLADIDVAWVADGDQRDRGHRREEMHEIFRATLRELDLSYVEIVGLGDQRTRVAVAAVEGIFEDLRP